MLHELRCWRREKKSAYLYRALSDRESGTPRQLLFLELANEADRQAELWRVEIRKSRTPDPGEFRPTSTLRWTAWLIVRWEPKSLARVLRWFNLSGLSVYTDWLEEVPQTLQELKEVSSTLAVWGNVLINFHDGLLFLMALLIGVAASGVEQGTQVILGVIGLILGAISTVAGEYFSVYHQQQAYRTARQHLQEYSGRPSARLSPKLVDEMTNLYRSQGVSRQQAITLLEQRLADDGLLDIEAPEPAISLPIAPPTLFWSAIQSGFAFMLGGLAVFAPLLFNSLRYPVLVTFSIAFPLLLIVGAMVAITQGRESLWGGLRSAGLGIATTGISYLIGSELGGIFF